MSLFTRHEQGEVKNKVKESQITHDKTPESFIVAKVILTKKVCGVSWIVADMVNI